VTLEMAGRLRMAGEIPGAGCCRADGGGGAGLFLARRGNAETWLPLTGGPVTVTSGASPNTFGDWASLGTPASDFYTSHLWACLANLPTQLGSVLAQFAYGADPAPLDASRSAVTLTDPTADASGYLALPLPCRSGKIPAGQELRARAWATIASRQLQVMVAGWLDAYPEWTPLPANTVVGPGRYYPSDSATSGVSVASATWGSWGAVATVVDPAPNDLLVTEVIFIPSTSAVLLPVWALQLGYGPAGSEVWCATPLHGHGAPSPWIWPPVWVKAGERLAVRAQGPSAANRQILVKVHDL
jgi:hypothetical protein